MAQVNIVRKVLTDKGWRNAALLRKKDGRINWPANGRWPKGSRIVDRRA